MTIHDPDGFAHVSSSEMDWSPSPSSTVWRKRLFHRGGAESGVVTSVVRYEEGSSFHRHEHPDGEEILVLEGTFSDDRGEHPAGTFMLNPEGYGHAPQSPGGCLLFVRLQQYPNTAQVRVDTTTGWRAHSRYAGVDVIELHSPAEGPAHYRMLRMAPGTTVDDVAIPAGEEIFVVSGSFGDEHGTYREGDWVRYPAGYAHSPASQNGATLLIKRGV
jgi:anti-sigma factor ChrR (cupin superfamily)